MIRIAIVEDDRKFIVELREFLQTYSRENGVSFQIATFTDGDEIVENYRADYDIILMDIQMQFMDGMTAAEKIREVDDEVTILFITGAPQFAVKGYRVGAMDFIVKPIEYHAFSESLSRAVRYLKKKNGKYITVNVRGGRRKINVEEIRFVEVFDHDLVFHMPDEEIEAKGSMNAIESEFPSQSFFKCSKGCIVNMRYVDAMFGNEIRLGDDRIQVSRARKKGMIDALNEYMESVGL